MGLPQIPSGNIAEEVSPSMSTIMQMPTRLTSSSSFEISGMHARQLNNRLFKDSPCMSPRECTHESDIVGLHNHSITNMHKLRIHSNGTSRFMLNHHGTNVQSPASRIVGFEPNASSDHANQGGEGTADVKDNANESSSYLVKKRLLSPHGISLLDEFRGDRLEIGSVESLIGFHSKGGMVENKKAHTGK